MEISACSLGTILAPHTTTFLPAGPELPQQWQRAASFLPLLSHDRSLCGTSAQGGEAYFCYSVRNTCKISSNKIGCHQQCIPAYGIFIAQLLQQHVNDWDEMRGILPQESVQVQAGKKTTASSVLQVLHFSIFLCMIAVNTSTILLLFAGALSRQGFFLVHSECIWILPTLHAQWLWSATFPIWIQQ